MATHFLYEFNKLEEIVILFMIYQFIYNVIIYSALAPRNISKGIDQILEEIRFIKETHIKQDELVN